MSNFTKINLNGEEKFVAAVYDGDGLEIKKQYATKSELSTEKDTLQQSINKNTTGLGELQKRVSNTEAFEALITKNATDISTNKTNIQTAQTTGDNALSRANEAYTLAGQVGTLLTAVLNTANANYLSINTLQQNYDVLNNIVNDEKLGITALNTKVDEHVVAIAALQTLLDKNTPLIGANTKSIKDVIGVVATLELDLGELRAKTETLPDKVLNNYNDLLDQIKALGEEIKNLKSAILEYHPKDPSNE